MPIRNPTKLRPLPSTRTAHGRALPSGPFTRAAPFHFNGTETSGFFPGVIPVRTVTFMTGAPERNIPPKSNIGNSIFFILHFSNFFSFKIPSVTIFRNSSNVSAGQ